MKAIGYIATTIILLALTVTYSGYALSVLWGWFIVPIFSLPVLSIPAAIGLALIVNYLTQDWKQNESDSSGNDALLKLAAVGFIKPTFALFFGYIYVQFI